MFWAWVRLELRPDQHESIRTDGSPADPGYQSPDRPSPVKSMSSGVRDHVVLLLMVCSRLGWLWEEDGACVFSET